MWSDQQSPAFIGEEIQTSLDNFDLIWTGVVFSNFFFLFSCLKRRSMDWKWRLLCYCYDWLAAILRSLVSKASIQHENVQHGVCDFWLNYMLCYRFISSHSLLCVQIYIDETGFYRHETLVPKKLAAYRVTVVVKVSFFVCVCMTALHCPPEAKAGTPKGAAQWIELKPEIKMRNLFHSLHSLKLCYYLLDCGMSIRR